jgi:hypothetical protein
LVDRGSVKAPVPAQPEDGDFAVLQQSVNRAWVGSQVFGKLSHRHYFVRRVCGRAAFADIHR